MWHCHMEALEKQNKKTKTNPAKLPALFKTSNPFLLLLQKSEIKLFLQPPTISKYERSAYVQLQHISANLSKKSRFL
jgi:hypothetical protein